MKSYCNENVAPYTYTFFILNWKYDGKGAKIIQTHIHTHKEYEGKSF